MRSDKMPKIMDKRRRTSTHKRQADKRRVLVDTPYSNSNNKNNKQKKSPSPIFRPISSGLELSTLAGFVFKVAHKTLY